MTDWTPTPEEKALSAEDTWRSLWLALAYRHGKCPVIAVERHREWCREMDCGED